MKQAVSFKNAKKETNDDKSVEWEITQEGQTVGSVYLALENQEYSNAPCVNVNLKEKQKTEELYTAALKYTITHTYCNVPCEFLYMRYPLTNMLLKMACQNLGFDKDGDQYEVCGLMWQNMKIAL